MDEILFWSLIESSWQTVGGQVQSRQKLVQGRLSEEGAEALLESLAEVIRALTERLQRLSAWELLTFDRILERKLYEIDRSQVQEHTGGSDDGYLYARGFVVAAGKSYYDAVNADLSIALPNLESEDMCFLAWNIYEAKFGEIPSSEISRESGSNRAGRPDSA